MRYLHGESVAFFYIQLVLWKKECKEGRSTMIKAVIFDLDGTLLNRDASVQKFIDDQYERLKNWLGHIPKVLYTSRFIELDCRGYVWKDTVYQQLTTEFNINGIIWKQLLKDYLEEFKNHCIPFPNLINMLEELKKKSYLMGIITNGRGQFQLDNIKALGIEKYFKTILISEWEEIKKPNPKIFEKALKHLNVLANEGVYVGDHPENDVKAAGNVGMKTIWKKDAQWNESEADIIIEDLREIPLIIEKLKVEGDCHMIKKLDFQKTDQVRALFDLQRVSYLIEAELINFFDIPPLKESMEELMESGETFFGYFEGDELAGAISYTIDDRELTICRMVVHPRHFRKGIAQALLTYIEHEHPELLVFKVSTGKDNTPAKNLYLRNGFKLVLDMEVVPGLFISHFEKRGE
jgi:putative hydrolase of the HAD superfamily